VECCCEPIYVEIEVNILLFIRKGVKRNTESLQSQEKHREFTESRETQRVYSPPQTFLRTSSPLI